VLIIEIVAAQIDQDPVIVDWRTWPETLRTTTWVGARDALAITAAVALAILILQLLPRRPSTIPVKGRDAVDGVDLSVRRRHLERTMAAEAAELDGIDRARVRRRPNRISVTARTSRRDAQGLDASLRSLVDSELERFDLDDSPDVQIRVEQGDRR
jgi:Family of unknown function (DUF6286)